MHQYVRGEWTEFRQRAAVVNMVRAFLMTPLVCNIKQSYYRTIYCITGTRTEGVRIFTGGAHGALWDLLSLRFSYVQLSSKVKRKV